jgi:MoxR-like ATPase
MVATAQDHSSMTSLQASFEKILNEYLEARAGPFSSASPVWSVFEQIRTLLQSATCVKDRPSLRVQWSAGIGNWTFVPWITIMDVRETQTPQQGVYIVYLFRADMTGLYVSLNQGVTELSKEYGKDATLAAQARSEILREDLSSLEHDGFSSVDKMDLRATGKLGQDYQRADISSKLYERGQVPSDGDLFHDLESLLQAYDEYLQERSKSSNEAEVQALAENLLPDAALRSQVLHVFARGIQLANESNDRSWETSLRSLHQTINLVVGPIYVMSLSPRGISISVTKQTRDALSPTDRQRVVSQGDFVRLPGTVWIEIQSAAFLQVYSKLRESHEEVIRLAAKNMKQTPYAKTHSQGVIRYLRAVDSNVVVPDPAFVFSTVAPLPPVINGQNKPSVWIFQANPNKYNLEQELEHVRVGDSDDWYAPTNQNDLQVGDIALLWQSGVNAGVYAVTEVTGRVRPRPVSTWRAEAASQGETEPAVPFRYTRILTSPVLKQTLLEQPGLQNMAIIRRPQGTIFPVQDSEWEVISPLLKVPVGLSAVESLSLCTNITVPELREFEELLESKKQVVLEGPPGSGKTFVGDAFARYFTGNQLQGRPNDRFVLVQFHQSYGYEDFIQGIRPETEDGALSYTLQDGIFKCLCDDARDRPNERFVILIDEINRGNISRIFGELLLLLEYRDKEARLPYEKPNRPLFSIPTNVYLLGTMNTADRSLAQIDYALRRRFFFYELKPVVEGGAPYLARWLSKQDPDIFPHIVQQEILRLFLELNRRVQMQLGEDFLIGHSYFMTEQIATEAGRRRIWQRAILPLLDEYFHNRQNREQILSEFSLTSLTAKSAILPASVELPEGE